MASNPFTSTYESLPSSLPIFSLEGVILLPKSQLQLNIFEPRYLNMVTDALGAGRLMAIVQPTPDGASDLYPVGCAGRITAFSETSDGRFLINITGVCRFVISEEIATIRGYRRVVVDWAKFRADLDGGAAAIDLNNLLETMNRYFELNNISVDRDALNRMPGEALVNFLAVNLPFDPADKQSLLETPGGEQRAQIVETLAKMAIADSTSPSRTRH